MDFSSTIQNALYNTVLTVKGQQAEIVVERKNTTEHIPVQFNPSEYQIIESNNYSQRSRRQEDEPVVNYNGSMLATFKTKLYFSIASFTNPESLIKGAIETVSDEENDDITKTIKKITDLTKIDGEKHAPPTCTFVWGSLLFTGIIENVGITYTMFDRMGKPLRATVDLLMRGFTGTPGKRKRPLFSPDRTKERTLTEDINIWNLAEKEYGDAKEWRRIAEANNIMNPLDIPVGKVLKLPSIND